MHKTQHTGFTLSTLTLSLLLAVPAWAGDYHSAVSPVGKQYIVVMKGSASVPNYRKGTRELDLESKAGEIERGYKGSKVRGVWRHALNGFTVGMSAAQAKKLAQDPDVALVEEDGYVMINTVQSNPVWNLDRIDQPLLPLNAQYGYSVNGKGVNAYVIDTGINIDHADFAGRAVHGYSALSSAGGLPDYADCNGHGTHVAGSLGGSNYGVAKGVKLVNVRVLNCKGSGTISAVISGINWVTQNRVLPAVANMSLGGGHSSAMDLALQNSIASGVTYAVAAGNENQPACNTSPADVPEAVTVGATDKTDKRASFSNYGSCVDLFAPGVSIASDWITGAASSMTLSGTSMASPHVAGAAALYLASYPGSTPAQVATALTSKASGVVSSAGTGSPNLLLSTALLGTPELPVDVTAPSLSLISPLSGQSLNGTVLLEANASDNVAVSRVEFFVDNTWVGSDDTAPYTLSWNSNAVLDGNHGFSAKAFDTAGLSSLSSAVSAAVINTVSSVPSVPVQPGCATASQLLVNQGFESGAFQWTSNVTGLISSDTSYPAASGNGYAKLGGTEKAGVNNLLQQISIPISACSANLTFKLNVLTDATVRRAIDTLTVMIADQNNKILGRVGSYSNLTKTNGYASQTIDLMAYRGSTIRLVFESVENRGRPTAFLLDDLAVNVTQ